MTSLILMSSGGLMVLVMLVIHVIVRQESSDESSSKAPLEGGLATTGQVCSVLSLQLLVMLVLLMVFDLEVVLVISFTYGGSLTLIQSYCFLLVVLLGLWAEWSWGKLSWAL